jgi:peptidoglycan L-alanyl-D-glutamate endopeptidase CwlK
VDVVPYPVDWSDICGFYEFAGFVKGIAVPLGIKVKWGGDFKTFFDGAHWELED